jgi:hypothetical protein
MRLTPEEIAFFKEYGASARHVINTCQAGLHGQPSSQHSPVPPRKPRGTGTVLVGGVI